MPLDAVAQASLTGTAMAAESPAAWSVLTCHVSAPWAQEHSEEVVAVTLHATGDYFVSASTDRTWAFCDVATGSVITQARAHPRKQTAPFVRGSAPAYIMRAPPIHPHARGTWAALTLQASAVKGLLLLCGVLANCGYLACASA
jgi:hypothetical protein